MNPLASTDAAARSRRLTPLHTSAYSLVRMHAIFARALRGSLADHGDSGLKLGDVEAVVPFNEKVLVAELCQLEKGVVGQDPVLLCMVIQVLDELTCAALIAI